MSISRTIALTALALAVALAGPARAFEIFGMRFFEAEQERTVIRDPIPYTVAFAHPDAPDDLATALRSASDLWVERSIPASGAIGLLGMANSDYRSLLAALYAFGYYAPEISIVVQGREAAAIPLNTAFPKTVSVRIEVKTGPAFVFGDVDVAPLAPPATTRNDMVDTPAQSGLTPGGPALAGNVGRAGDAAVEGWRQQGYPHVKLAQQRIVAEHKDHTLDVSLRLAPGKKASYGPVEVRGNNRVDPGFLRFMASLPQGEEYDPDDLAAARKRLARLQVFRDIRIDEADTLSEKDALPVSLYVREHPLRRFGFGATFSSIDGIGAEAYWMHRNLFGRAERLRFDASIDGVRVDDGFAQADYHLGVQFTKPGLIFPDMDLVAAIETSREKFDGGDLQDVEMHVGLTYRLGDLETGLSAFRTFSEERDGFGFREFDLVGLRAGATLDRRNETLDPSRGYYVSATLSPMQEFNFDNTGLRSTIEGRAYVGFGEDDRFVVAGRAFLGSMSGLPISESPGNLLFHSGGGGSVRGYAYESFGVYTGPVFTGGLSVINLSAEFRASISDTIGIVGFIDAGTVGSGAMPDFSADWHRGFGIGLRYETGLGPLRVDLARGLDLRAGDPDFAIYVGLGQSF